AIKMPALSPTMEEGTLARWLVKVGDEVRSGDIMAEIETDKATMEFEAVDEGVIAQIAVAEGTEGVKVGTVIAMLAEEGEDPASVSGSAGQAETPKSAEPAKKEAAAPAAAATAAQPAAASAPAAAPASSSAKAGTSGQTRVGASPLGKRSAAEKGIDLAAISA